MCIFCDLVIEFFYIYFREIFLYSTYSIKYSKRYKEFLVKYCKSKKLEKIYMFKDKMVR